MKHNIQAYVYPDSGGYVAECPALHAVTQGDTLDETMANLKEVIALALEGEDPAELGELACVAGGEDDARGHSLFGSPSCLVRSG